MPRSMMTGMVLRGVASCVPEKEVFNDRDYPWFEPVEIRKVTGMAGVKSHRMADEKTCTSDLCNAAGKKLLDLLGWEASSIDGLILMSPTPDYVMPPTSCLLQNWLGLSEDCACFDVGLGCSAYVYGLWLANSLLNSRACRRILLFAGDTASKYVNPKDRTTALLFGDAATATALEYTEDTASSAYYILKTDGSGWRDLIVPGGGFRDRRPEDNNQRFLSMDGARIFDFTRFRVPDLIQQTLQYAQVDAGSYDYFIFHQANEYLIKFIASKSGINLKKVPLWLKEYGNVNAASIPLTLALSGVPDGAGDPFRVMFLGFGVGLSWGSASMSIPASSIFHNFTYQANAS